MGMIGIYSLGAVSGANFNPAVSIALTVMGCLGWGDFGITQLCVYLASQLLGAAAGAFVNTLIWLPHSDVPASSTVGNSSEQVLQGNITLPWRNAVIESTVESHGALSVLGAETLYTFVLVFVILNVATCNDVKKSWYFGLAIGFVIVAAASAVGGISFCCLNPAVSFGATLMNSAYAKVESQTFALWEYFLYAAFEILGALIGCALFYVCRMHLINAKKGKKPPKPSMCSMLVSEFLGTFVLCVTVQLVVNAAPSPIGALGIAASLMVMIYALANVSGANFNPAVSFALLLNGGLDCMMFSLYVITQLAASCFAAFIAWIILEYHLDTALVVRHGTGVVAGAAGGDWLAVVVAEAIFTGLLVFTVLNVAVADGGNQYYGLAIGFVIVVGAASVGSVSGGCFNPAVAVSLDLVALCFVEPNSGAEYGWSWLYFLVELLGAAIAWGLFKCARHGEEKEELSSHGEEKEELSSDSETEAFQ